MKRVFVAGATGMLGREVVKMLVARGHKVRALTRDPERAKGLVDVERHIGDALEPESLRAAFEGIDIVFSSVGAPVSIDLKGWTGYRGVDIPANTNLIEAAKAAGVKRFVYVSAHVIPETAGYAYFAAHEEVARRVLASGMDGRVLRPTAFFSALRPFVEMAKAGKTVPVLGDGSFRSNPIADVDLAESAVDVLIRDDAPREQSLGGPDVLTRQEIAGLACDAVGRPRRLRNVPAWLARMGSIALTPINPRFAQLVRFATEASVHDLVAPVAGTRHLADWFRDAGAGRV